MKDARIFYKNILTTKEAIIKTDKEKVFPILTNLVKNAIKFTDAGSINFGYEKKKVHLLFFVKDTGVGINQEVKAAIFERFRQGSESLSRNYEGAGLGLSISKAYVEKLGGKIWIESGPEKGSELYFTLPYNTYNQKEMDNKGNITGEPEDFQVNSPKILIIEDDESSQLLLSEIIEIFCKEILYAKTGIEAVELCQK